MAALLHSSSLASSPSLCLGTRMDVYSARHVSFRATVAEAGRCTAVRWSRTSRGRFSRGNFRVERAVLDEFVVIIPGLRDIAAFVGDDGIRVIRSSGRAWLWLWLWWLCICRAVAAATAAASRSRTPRFLVPDLRLGDASREVCSLSCKLLWLQRSLRFRRDGRWSWLYRNPKRSPGEPIGSFTGFLFLFLPLLLPLLGILLLVLPLAGTAVTFRFVSPIALAYVVYEGIYALVCLCDRL